MCEPVGLNLLWRRIAGDVWKGQAGDLFDVLLPSRLFVKDALQRPTLKIVNLDLSRSPNEGGLGLRLSDAFDLKGPKDPTDRVTDAFD